MIIFITLKKAKNKNIYRACQLLMTFNRNVIRMDAEGASVPRSMKSGEPTVIPFTYELSVCILICAKQIVFFPIVLHFLPLCFVLFQH